MENRFFGSEFWEGHLAGYFGPPVETVGEWGTNIFLEVSSLPSSPFKGELAAHCNKKFAFFTLNSISDG